MLGEVDVLRAIVLSFVITDILGITFPAQKVSEKCISDNKYYNSGIYQVTTATSWQDCQKNCQADPSCSVVNFHKTTLECSLVSAPVKNSLTDDNAYATIFRVCYSDLDEDANGAVYYGASRYKIIAEEVRIGSTDCAGKLSGSSLMEPTNSEEEKFLHSFLHQKGTAKWFYHFGYQKSSSGHGWKSGASWTHTHWCANEPSLSNSVSNSIATIFIQGGFCWDDFEDQTISTYHYICERQDVACPDTLPSVSNSDGGVRRFGGYEARCGFA